MRETQRQIEKYKAQLPHMRERVVASLLLLVVAAVTMVSASFAWIVLSSNPEVKGMNTTITSNGNLEIALANGTTITQPADSEVGDGGKDLALKNITWGNLINLGDPIYGLENLVLRPATLNTNSLLEKPLYAAGYGTDGRVDTLESDFAYAYWNQDQFSADQVKYGVRAIASVEYGPAPGQNVALADAVKTAETAVNTASSGMQKLAKDAGLQDLVSLMGSYIQAQITEKLQGKEPIVNISVSQVDSIYLLMDKLQKNMEESADALAAIYNMEMLRRTEPSYLATNKFTGEYLLTASQSEIQDKLKAKNGANEIIVQPSMLSYLWTLRADYNTLKSDLAVIATYVGRDDVVYRNLDGSTYPAIETYVNHIVDVGTCTINGTAIGKLSMSNIGSLTGGGTKPIVIHKGIIQRMDKFTGAQIETDVLSVTVMGSKAKGKATTSATSPYVLPEEQERALGADTSYKGSNPIAGDTFGMALDFFVRTNASNSHLILQGSPVYEEREETVSAIIEGEARNLYTVEIDGEKQTAYLKDGVYYAYDREYGVAGEELGAEQDLPNATLLKEKVKYIVGYSGVNRVWEDSESAMLDGDSTTQGAGSCYTFYAATPEDQEKSLQLLSHFRIAFIDQEGTLLGTAQLDVDKKVEQTGKVVVPLSLSVTNNSIEGPDGNPLYTITELEQNQATLITAVIYLDGQGLTNDQVLAAGEIQGQLNLQFGSSADMDAMDDPILMESKCRVTAVMDGEPSVAFDVATADQLKKTITATVEGYTPSKVEGYFLREINSTQGIRQEKMVFTKGADGKWTATHQFTAPGKYILREIFLDGVAYELDQQPIVFTVEGFTVSDVYCQDNGKTYMRTDKSFETSVSLTFASSNKMPASVKGAFIHQETGNRTTVYFTRDTGSTWTGSATFTTSGEYRMDYLELDGQYFGLEQKNHVSINLYLGISASVYTGNTNFALENGEARDVEMSLIIQTDNGEVLGNLGNVWLQYSNNGSGVQEQGLGAGMVWNSSRQMYMGTFHLENPGIYNYRYVSIKLQGDETSYLNEAAIAPTITAISSNPPKYVSKEGFGEVFALNNSAKFTVRMKNADSATIDAVLKNEAGETYYVRGTMVDEGEEQVFTFGLPIIGGTQSGTWTLDSLYMTNVYGGKDNILYDGSTANGPDTETEDKPLYTVADNYYIKWLEWTLADITNEGETQEPIIRVVSDVNVAFTNAKCNESKDFGKTNGEVTATFGTRHPLEDLELEITAGSEGKPLSEYGITVKAILLIYRYDRDSVSGGNNTFGSYTMDTDSWGKLISDTNTRYDYTLASNDGTKYTLSTSNDRKEISIAGRYKTDGKIEVTLEDANGNEFFVQQSLDAPTFSVWSKAMSVSIKSIAPEGKHTTVNKNKDAIRDVESKREGNTVTIYCEASRSGNTISFDTYPHVELTLNDKGDMADSVEMVFSKSGGETVHLYTAVQMNGKTDGYVWKDSADCVRYVGQYKPNKICSSTSFVGAGTLTGSSLTIKHGDYTYNMAVDAITINNPDKE